MLNNLYGLTEYILALLHKLVRGWGASSLGLSQAHFLILLNGGFSGRGSSKLHVLGLPSPLSRLGRERREILYSQTRMLNKWSGGGVGTLVSPQFPI